MQRDLWKESLNQTSNKTIIATMHQPSSKMFHLCDNLLLLCHGQVILSFSNILRMDYKYFWSWFGLDLQLPVQSVLITTKDVISNPIHGEVYSIQHYVIKFVSDNRSSVFSGYSGFLHQL
jgi:ABC-type cobalamin/Fe3+-siderophores transport system ATPase subunit